MSDNPERRPMVSAFVTGLFMGFAAPAFILTALASKPQKGTAAALADDWTKIGNDMSQAFQGRPEKNKA